MAGKVKSEEMKYTKYEKARIIGSRALQISMGAPFTLKISKKELEKMGYNPISIAKKEFEAKTLPLYVMRLNPWDKRESED